MSVSLDNKRIVYLNLSKTGRESLNSADSQEFCEVKLSFRDSPLLDKQDDYVVAATRFGVPLSEVPTMAFDKVEIHDLHATILHLLGLDHKKLTFKHSGRRFRLTDVAGRVIKPIIA